MRLYTGWEQNEPSVASPRCVLSRLYFIRVVALFYPEIFVDQLAQTKLLAIVVSERSPFTRVYLSRAKGTPIDTVFLCAYIGMQFQSQWSEQLFGAVYAVFGGVALSCLRKVQKHCREWCHLRWLTVAERGCEGLTITGLDDFLSLAKHCLSLTLTFVGLKRVVGPSV